MKLLRIVGISIIVSVFLSFIRAIIVYTPLSEREPNIYYSSLLESFLFIMYFLTPFLIILSIVAYVLYLLFKKFIGLPKILIIILSIFISGSSIFLTFFIVEKNNETDDIYLIPEGYEGDVFVFYNVKGGQPLETENGYDLHYINENGYFVTNEPDMDYGTVTDQYFYVDEVGNRTSISDTCISLFGTGGYSTTEKNQQIDIIYTGFNLTKDECSEEFMLGNHDHQESNDNAISEIVEKYYDGSKQ